MSPVGRRVVLPRSFFAPDARLVAPLLLNKVIVRGHRSARIVEVEAYVGADDPASHAYRGPTARNMVMFGPPGHLYVYFTYGLHWCANSVCGADGQASAVLLRAAQPLTGLDDMRGIRLAARRDRDLANGPAKLCQAMGIDGDHNGLDLMAGDQGVTIVDDGLAPPSDPGVSPRIGLRVGVETPWRWYVPDDPNVSRRPRPRAS